MSKHTRLFFFLFLVLGFSACRTDDTDTQHTLDLRLIEDYIAAKNIQDVSKTASGLHYKITKPGEDKTVQDTSVISMRYTGRLLNDDVFDSSDSLRVALKDLIAGFREGIPLVREGGEIKLIVPSKLGYGSSATSSIPANSVLVFDVALFEVDPE